MQNINQSIVLKKEPVKKNKEETAGCTTKLLTKRMKEKEMSGKDPKR